MIRDVSADGHQHPDPVWLASHRLLDKCACWVHEVCPVHGKFRRPGCVQPCGDSMIREQAAQGVDVEAFHSPPKTITLWAETRVCQHGRRYWMQPTADQLRIWRYNRGGY